MIKREEHLVELKLLACEADGEMVLRTGVARDCLDLKISKGSH